MCYMKYKLSIETNTMQTCNFAELHLVKANQFLRTEGEVSHCTARQTESLLAEKKDKGGWVGWLCDGEENKTVPGRQGQRPEYQEVGSGDRRLSGWRVEGAFSAQGTSVLKHPRLCLSRRTPSRSHGLLVGGVGGRERAETP